MDTYGVSARGPSLKRAGSVLDGFPMLAAARERALRLFELGNPGTRELIDAIEGDAALAIAVLRAANRGHRHAETALEALEAITPTGLRAILEHAQTFDFFQRPAVWSSTPECFRSHAVSTQRAAQRIAAEIGFEQRDRLMLTALLHDIGKLALTGAVQRHPGAANLSARTPSDRAADERLRFGFDHAAIGGELARSWHLPAPVCRVIEAHHSACDESEPAIVRLADMLAHYSAGGYISRNEMMDVASALGLDLARLREILYVLGLGAEDHRARQVAPCPMSAREIDVLRRLAQGMVYKQIARELGLSASTVRTHLHNVYVKLGATDRAQAVLIATERGWL